MLRIVAIAAVLLTFCLGKTPKIGASYQLGCLRSKAGTHEKMVHSRNRRRGATDLERSHGSCRHRRIYRHPRPDISRTDLCSTAAGVCGAATRVLTACAGVPAALRAHCDGLFSSEERRVGKECVNTCRSQRAP